MTKKEIVLTGDGYKRLVEELDFLEKQRRREIACRIKESIEFGDLSENSEYDDAKNEQAFVEGRIIQLRELINNARVIKKSEIKTKEVSIGCKVVLKEIKSKEKVEYTIVGSVEADPSKHRISNESPVGQSIIGKKAGDKVTVNVPQGAVEYEIVKIKK